MNSTIRILHVDDDPEFVDMAATFLEHEDDRFEVETATSALDGFDRLTSDNFDCIVSDYEMPGQNGIEFLQTVREAFHDLPFILYTGKGSEEVASDAISAGVTDYLQKDHSTSQFTVLANRIINAVEQYQAQTELQAREQRFQALLEYSPDRLAILDEDGHYQFISPAVERMFGYSPEEIEGKDSLQFVHPDDHEKIRESRQQLFANPDRVFTIEYRVRHKDGSWRWVEARGRNRLDDPAVNGIIVNTRDITERKKREQQLAHERDRFETLFETLHEPAMLVSGENEIDATISRVNNAFEEAFGYEENEIIDEHINDLIVPPDRQEEAEQIDQKNVAGDLISTEVRRLTADNEQRDFLLLTSQFTTDSGADPYEGFAIYADITDRKKREQQLAHERDRFELLFETLPEPTVLLQGDRESIIQDVNPAFEDVFGYDGNEIRGKNLNELIVPPEKQAEAKQIDSRNYEGELYTTEVQRQTADGQLRDFLLFATDRIKRDDTTPSEGFVIYADITERKESQRELQRQNERLDEFASIVAHDLRNPLNVANGYLELARSECDSDHLNAVDRAHDRMTALIDDLLTLAREGESVTDFEPIELDDLITRCWENVITSDATLRINIDRRINGDEFRLQQLLENLFRNAVEHGGDDVTVTVGHLDDTDGFYVADDGPGIPDDKQEQIFESGYSTAEAGTGLGLVIVEEIAEAHGWEITVTDSDDGGVRFEITGVEFDQ